MKRFHSLPAALSMGALLAITPLLASTPAHADVATPVNGSLTVTVPGTATPITVSAGQPTPAMTFTASGVGLSGFPNSTYLTREIQVRPGGNSSRVTWQAEGWSTMSSCPTGDGDNPGSISRTTTLSDCGITGVYINDVEITGLQVYAETTTTQIPNTLLITTISGDMFATPDSVGEVRVELAAGTWVLDDGATTTNSWSMAVRGNAGSMQGRADTFSRSVTFNPNGGVGYAYAQQERVNAEGALRANAFTHATDEFAGWNTDPAGRGAAYADGAAFTFSQSQTLYAQWREAASEDSTDGGADTGADDTGSNTDEGTTNEAPAANTGSDPKSAELATTGWDAAQAVMLALAVLLAGSALVLTARRGSVRSHIARN